MSYIIFIAGAIAVAYLYKATKPKKYQNRKVSKTGLVEDNFAKLTERQRLYRQYLNTEHWRKTRYAALDRANYKCEKCDDTDKLQVHHLNYSCLWHETEKDLLVLCRKCHAREHNKKI